MVQRWRFVPVDGTRDPEGGWVEYSDYAKLVERYLKENPMTGNPDGICRCSECMDFRESTEPHPMCYAGFEILRGGEGLYSSGLRNVPEKASGYR